MIRNSLCMSIARKPVNRPRTWGSEKPTLPGHTGLASFLSTKHFLDSIFCTTGKHHSRNKSTKCREGADIYRRSEDVSFPWMRVLHVGVHRHQYYQMIARKKGKIIFTPTVHYKNRRIPSTNNWIHSSVQQGIDLRQTHSVLTWALWYPFQTDPGMDLHLK